jgi:hypothetical protein
MDLDGESPLSGLGESKGSVAVFIGLVALAGVLLFVFLGSKTVDLGVSPAHPLGTLQKFDAFLTRLGADKSPGNPTTTHYKLKEGRERGIRVESEVALTIGFGGRLRHVWVKTLYVDPTERPVLFSKFRRVFDHYWRSIARRPRVFKPVDGSDPRSLTSAFTAGKVSGYWIKSPQKKTETITIELNE